MAMLRFSPQIRLYEVCGVQCTLSRIANESEAVSGYERVCYDYIDNICPTRGR